MMMREEHDVVYFLYEADWFFPNGLRYEFCCTTTQLGVFTRSCTRAHLYLRARKRRQNVQSVRAENDDAIAFFFYFFFFFFSAAVR